MNENRSRPPIGRRIPPGQIWSEKQNRKRYMELKVAGKKGIELVPQKIFKEFENKVIFDFSNIFSYDDDGLGTFSLEAWVTDTQKEQVIYYLSTFDGLSVEEL